MQVSIPLDKMTIEEKLQVLEEIWDDLQKTPDDVPSPAWHADVLRVREDRIKEGKSEFKDWADAKRNIRKQTK